MSFVKLFDIRRFVMLHILSTLSLIKMSLIIGGSRSEASHLFYQTLIICLESSEGNFILHYRRSTDIIKNNYQMVNTNFISSVQIGAHQWGKRESGESPERSRHCNRLQIISRHREVQVNFHNLGKGYGESDPGVRKPAYCVAFLTILRGKAWSGQ